MKLSTRIAKGITAYPLPNGNKVKTVRLRSKIDQVVTYHDKNGHLKAIQSDIRAVWLNTDGVMRGKTRLFKHSEPVTVKFNESTKLWSVA